MNSYIKYTILLEEYKKLKNEIEENKKKNKDKEIQKPDYKNINELDYPPQAF